MLDQQQQPLLAPANEVSESPTAVSLTPETVPVLENSAPTENVLPAAATEQEVADLQPADLEGVESRNQHVEAGRKGAQRVHQLIREGKLYEAEHGLKSGRQRLRQLLELGKRYEQEHGSRPPRERQRRERLSRSDREELLTTFLRCVLRLAKPSFRAELVELIGKLQKEQNGQAA